MFQTLKHIKRVREMIQIFCPHCEEIMSPLRYDESKQKRVIVKHGQIMKCNICGELVMR